MPGDNAPKNGRNDNSQSEAPSARSAPCVSAAQAPSARSAPCVSAAPAPSARSAPCVSAAPAPSALPAREAPKKSRKKTFYRAASLLSLCAAAASFIYIAVYAVSFVRHKKLNSSVAALYGETGAESGAEISPAAEGAPAGAASGAEYNGYNVEIPARDMLLLAEEANRERFADLLAINPEFRGMLIIDGLGIKEPYAQAPDNDKYLNTDFSGKRSSYGTIFLHCDNDRLLTDKNIVFFGHHMRAGEMFAPLTKYQNPAVVEQAPYIVLDGLTGKSLWIVFAAYTCEPDYGYINTRVTGPSFDELLEEILSRSLFCTNVDVTSDDQIITLSTCNYDFQDARFAVHARRLRPREAPPKVEAFKNPSPKPYNIPNLRNLTAIYANNAAVMRHPTSQKTYIYQVGETGLEWFVGNGGESVQGAYNAYAKDITCSALACAQIPGGKTLLCAADLNGQTGVFMFCANFPYGRMSLLDGGPVTPPGVPAKNPFLFVDEGAENEIWLFATVASENAPEEEIHHYKITPGGECLEDNLIFTFPESDWRVVGCYGVYGEALLILQKKGAGELYARFLNAGGEPLLRLDCEGGAEKIVFYGKTTDGAVRLMREKNNRFNPQTYVLPQVFFENAGGEAGETAEELGKAGAGAEIGETGVEAAEEFGEAEAETGAESAEEFGETGAEAEIGETAEEGAETGESAETGPEP